MKLATRTLLILLSAGMILSTGVGDFVNSDVIAKSKKSKKSKKQRIPYQWNELDLSKDQISKIAGMIPKELADLYSERNKARKPAGDDKDKKKAIDKPFNKKMKPLKAEWEEEASSVLTKDQKKKLAEIKSNKKKKNKK